MIFSPAFRSSTVGGYPPPPPKKKSFCTEICKGYTLKPHFVHDRYRILLSDFLGVEKKREAHAPSVGKYGENNALEQPPQDRKHIL